MIPSEKNTLFQATLKNATYSHNLSKIIFRPKILQLNCSSNSDKSDSSTTVSKQPYQIHTTIVINVALIT